jgi:hypothetical protein
VKLTRTRLVSATVLRPALRVVTATVIVRVRRCRRSAIPARVSLSFSCRLAPPGTTMRPRATTMVRERFPALIEALDGGDDERDVPTDETEHDGDVHT